MAASERIRVDVILPAAGTSERMSLPVAKQFLKVLGKHILAYTVDSFHRLVWVRYIVVVVSPEQVKVTAELMESYGFNRVRVCAGSHTRHRSIFLGLQALASDCSGSDVVIIHDAARPFVSEAVAEEVAGAAMRYGAAGVTRPLVSTVIRCEGDDNLLVESLDRTLYRNSEMPQAFHYDIITSAYAQSTESDLDFGTECLLLALKYCRCAAKLVHGTEDLWKVTYQKDVYSMESVVKEKFMAVSIQNTSGRDFPAVTVCKNWLLGRKIKVAESREDPANTFIIICSGLTKNSLELVADKICQLYDDWLPESAVRLDFMVVMVFLRITAPTGRVQFMPAHRTTDKLAQEWGNPQKCGPVANPDIECYTNNGSSSDDTLDQSSDTDKYSSNFNCTNLKLDHVISSGHNLKLSSESSRKSCCIDSLYQSSENKTFGSSSIIYKTNKVDRLNPSLETNNFESLHSCSETKDFGSFHSCSETKDFESFRSCSETNSLKHNVDVVHPLAASSSTENATHSHGVHAVATADILYNTCQNNHSTASSDSTNETMAVSYSVNDTPTTLEPDCFSPSKTFPRSCIQEEDGCAQSTDCLHLLEYSKNYQDYRSVNCNEIIKIFKQRLRKISRRPSIVSGVICGVDCPVGDRLAELVWQRSSLVDGQVLDYQD